VVDVRHMISAPEPALRRRRLLRELALRAGVPIGLLVCVYGSAFYLWGCKRQQDGKGSESLKRICLSWDGPSCREDTSQRPGVSSVTVAKSSAMAKSDDSVHATGELAFGGGHRIGRKLEHATTDCGNPTVQPPAEAGEWWRYYECRLDAIADGGRKCLRRAQYTRDPARGCPGAERCCLDPKLAGVSQGFHFSPR
jgi:hypothetical protein